MKYEDLNCSGVYDSGEPTLPGWIITVTNGTYTDYDTTDATGAFAFYNLWMGLQFVSETQQPGWVQVSPTTINYNAYLPTFSSVVNGVDFGNVNLSHCDIIDQDTCLGGVDDNFGGGTAEPAMPSPNLQSSLSEYCFGAPTLDFDQPAHDQCFGHTFRNCIDTTCCIVSGQLCLRLMATNAGSADDELQIGDWFGAPGIWRINLSKLLQIKTGGVDSVWNPGDTMTICLDLANLPDFNGVTSVIPLLQDGKVDILLRDDTMIDFAQLTVGSCCPGGTTCSISGTKFYDKDRDGVVDVGESGLAGWTINLYLPNGTLYASTTTDAFGNYTFTGLPCDTFVVSEVGQPNWVQTYPSPNSHTLDLGVSGSVTGINFGNFRCGAANDTCCTKVPPKMVAWYSLDENTPSTAYDKAGNDNPGTHIGTFGFVPGKVAGAYQFGPTPANQDIVRVYNDPFVGIGASDFSADVWIYPTSFSTNCATFLLNPGNAPCVDPIFDNRQWFFGGSGLDGVCFFVQDDNQGTGTAVLGLTMSSFPTPQTVFTTPPGTISLNQWQHVAVTVSRTTGVGTFYLNGAAVGTFTPIAGPLYSTNAGPILDIGHGTFLNTGSCYLTNRYFDGKIDELEIFDRALTQSEVQDLFNAGSSGKCKVRCQVPKVTSFCKFDTQKTVNITVCNESNFTTSYNWSLAGMPTGGSCTFNGTGMTFSPANGSTGPIPPGMCVNIPVVIYRPSGFTIGNVACYSFSVIDPVTGASSTCQGTIKAVNKWCPIIIDPHTLISLSKRQSVDASFTIENDSDSSETFQFRVEAISEESGTKGSVVRLNGLPPGQPYEGSLSIPLGTTANMPLVLELASFVALDFHDLLISFDTDGDGVLRPGLAGAIKPESFTDCNRNGRDDADDIAEGVSTDANGNGVPDECEATCSEPYCSRCYLCGDANADRTVNISDAVYLIAYIFAGGSEPSPVLAGDANCSGTVNISDAVYLVAYIFSGGLPPCEGCK